ncbi:DUF58 domain-containing protein [Natrialbaceae archaeon A-arb3/5]
MRLTIRGWSALVAIVLALAMSWEYGPRSLNAVVASLSIVTVAGVALTARIDPPAVRRHAVDDGTVGETRTVAVTVDSESTVSATLRETVGAGLSTGDEPPTVETTFDADSETRVEYELTCTDRGERTVGPLSITITDVFGLVRRRFDYDETTSILVYPRSHRLRGDAVERLTPHADRASRTARDEFDHLRKYRRGDSLRDVHWKSTAKRATDELLVTEHVTDEETRTLTVAAECSSGQANDLATATASIVTTLLDADVRVDLVLPDERRSSTADYRSRHTLLRALALLEPGNLEASERRNADVLVQGGETDVTVTVDGTELAFDRLRNEAALEDRTDRPDSADRRTRSDNSDGDDSSTVMG